MAGISGAAVFVIVCVICAAMESEKTATFKWFHVYGRVKAFFALDFTMMGILGIGSVILPWFDNMMGDTMHPVTAVLFCLGSLLIGLGMYASSYEKCPQFLRKSMIPSMIISGCGVCLKVVLFFLVFLWKMNRPKHVQTVDGRDFYIYRNNAYDPKGKCVGTVSNDGSSIIETKVV